MKGIAIRETLVLVGLIAMLLAFSAASFYLDYDLCENVAKAKGLTAEYRLFGGCSVKFEP